MRAGTPEGWEGRIVALDRSGRRATLDAGGLRVSAPVEELVALEAAADDGRRAAGAASVRSGRPGVAASARPRAGRKGEFGTGGGSVSAPVLRRPATLPLTLDVRGARVDEALELLDAYLDRAVLAGLEQVTVVHGSGTGALRDAVRDRLAGHPQVGSWRPGGRGEGGDGATIVAL
jgi:hypothetical protein